MAGLAKIKKEREVIKMIGCDGKPTKDSLAQFLSLSTGKSFESAYMDLSSPKIWREPKLSYEFDYRDLIGQSKFNPLGKPTFKQVTDFMAKETGCTHESAMIKLSMPKFLNDVNVVGGVTMYPVSMINAI